MACLHSFRYAYAARYAYGVGKKTSVWLDDDLWRGWKASRLPLAELVRRGLEMDAPSRPLDEPALRRVVREIIRDELAALPVAADRTPAIYGGEWESEPYLQDP